MKILAISGSASKESSNALLLKTIKEQFSASYDFEVYENLRNLPLFRPEDNKGKIPESVLELRQKCSQADALIICTPEYTHNIPAVVKNALEWMTESGELADKKILPITFTPHEPRGEYAMKSLLFSLQTMNARVVTQLPLYKTDVEIRDGKMELNDDYLFLIGEALKLL
ncbi:MAG: NADPH-dependent FMN reductase [Chitinophagales bacterium]